ncbi:MAG: UDP-N-acetylmuramoyl-L-alanyl-D-glutamate--2,6-diaminopimelate ligase [Bifidobacteriaceae bacterium]|jgi:UDP-N-acetylmuramoyl-L-alanyl-D-glutamate--2,6-diaminopimelate ligase|nr:UDP-N-acetylmuramoyl-L-alanyl-D-glutamate--2,6-diaminopimelate ligase [Bifidobacteriaceae bacterium]
MPHHVAGQRVLRPSAVRRVSLDDAARRLPAARLAGEVAGSVGLTGLSLDSQRVQPGDLFVALPGAKTHGGRHAAAALAAGATAVLTDPAGEGFLAAATPRIVVGDPRAELGALAAWLYGHPARRLRLAGITGTNGKTSTAHLLEGALRRPFGKVALLGTIAARLDGQEIPSARTTMEAPDLQAALAAMVEQGVRACVMEVSSHALAQHRVDGFQFDVVAFTNLTRDHLDYHRSMEDYFAAKASLFTPAHARRAVVNLEDDWGRRLARQAQIPVETLAQSQPADWIESPSGRQGGRTAFRLTGPGGVEVAAEVALPGVFNLHNAALALVSAIALGVDGPSAAAGVAAVAAVPGRMEVVAGPPGAPLAVVDYAHAPDAVAKALAALRPHTAGRLIAVLGAGGDRDHGKRELMGRAAVEGADMVFITDDNPRGEDPAAIRAALRLAVGARAREVPDRAEAIWQAIAEARQGDTVVILGKGHERTIDYGGELRPHLDAETAGRALMKEGER